MIKLYLSYFTPPIFIIFYNKFLNPRSQPNILFDGDDALFKRVIKDAEIYGEYGIGKSTDWVLNNTKANVIVVDTSLEWIERLKANHITNASRLNINHVNLGEVGDWGRPESYSHASSFDKYTDLMWSQGNKPECILIDGRFRVCCFLTTLKFADSGTKILFDDYINRPHYHFVEKYVSRMEECGRQCLFVVPHKHEIDLDELESDIHKFRYVMD